jgi:hypothetical protein
MRFKQGSLLFGLRGLVILILWIRSKSVAGAEYARLNTGGSITRGNSGNGALPTLNGKKVRNKNIAPNDRASVGLPWSCVSTTVPASS